MSTTPTNEEQLRAEVRARYTKAALQVLGTEQAPQAEACCGPTCCSTDTPTPAGAAEPLRESPLALPVIEAEPASSCCGSDCCSPNSAGGGDPITSNLYAAAELGTIPLAAALASRGCGNPTALAELKEGERVLDLGSGGGIDVLLSARRVGPSGFAYGLDMTDAMLAVAERNKAESGIQNVQFLKGIIEEIPLPEQSVDVVISNCVINLSADKGRVLREAYRVLAPGGRLAVADIVIQGSLPPAVQSDMEAWAGCIAGALPEETYRALLTQAGFSAVEIQVTRRYSLQDIADSGAGASIAALTPAERADLDGTFVSAFIRAQKPDQVS